MDYTGYMRFLFNKYGTDKSNKHWYDLIYEPCLEKKKNDPINILEVGIHRGASTGAFYEYFPKGQIYAIDLFKRVEQSSIKVLQTERAHSIKTDSTLESTADLIKKEWGEDIKFDFIIDDGAHYPKANRLTFESLFPFLKEDGSYFIEDLWPLHLMTAEELKHGWICGKAEEVYGQHYNYSMDEHNKLLDVINQFKVTHYDNRKRSRNPDSYIIKIENK